MTTYKGLKALTLFTALLAGGTSLAIAQNGLPTGGQPPVAGGAAGNPITNPEYYHGYYATSGYVAAPGAPYRSMYMYAPQRRSGRHHAQNH